MPQDQPPFKAYKACLGCRRRRTRCDRKQPCQRCQQYSVECIHVDTRQKSKPELRLEKANLEAHLDNASVILETLAQGTQTNTILQLLRSGASLEALAKGIRARKSQKPPQPVDNAGVLNLDHRFPPMSSFMTTINEGILSIGGAQETTATRPPQPSQQDTQDTLSSLGPNAIRPGTSDGSSPMNQSLFSNIPSPSSHRSSVNSIFGQHQNSSIYHSFYNMPIDLMSLPCKLVIDFTSAFFTWKDLPFPIIRKSLFLSDFLAGRSNHCSPALIRSISCLGCHALSGHNTESTYATLGNRLFTEACFLLVLNPDPVISIGDVQAFGLLALYQLGVGRNADAILFADEGARRMAVMADEKVKIEVGEFDPLSASMRAEALSSAVSIARFIRLITSYASQEQTLTTSPQLPANCFGQDDGPPDVVKSLNLDGLVSSQPLKEDIPKVTILIYRLLDWIYHISTESVLTEVKLPNNLLYNYKVCLVWYEQALKQREEPLFLHLVYHFCLLVLFRPHFDVLSTSAMSPARIFQESREAILSLAASSNNLGYFVQSLSLNHLFIQAAGETNYCNIPLGGPGILTRTLPPSVFRLSITA